MIVLIFCALIGFNPQNFQPVESHDQYTWSCQRTHDSAPKQQKPLNTSGETEDSNTTEVDPFFNIAIYLPLYGGGDDHRDTYNSNTFPPPLLNTALQPPERP